MDKGSQARAAVQAMVAEMVMLRERETYLKNRLAVGHPSIELIVELEQVAERINELNDEAEHWGPFDMPS
jgi:hypothetical protein